MCVCVCVCVNACISVSVLSQYVTVSSFWRKQRKKESRYINTTEWIKDENEGRNEHWKKYGKKEGKRAEAKKSSLDKH